MIKKRTFPGHFTVTVTGKVVNSYEGLFMGLTFLKDLIIVDF